MNIYNYSEVSGAYLSTTVAKLSPLEEGVSLVPANATDIKIPAYEVGVTIPVFQNDAWNVVEDNRGRDAWSTETTEPFVVTEVGSLPETLTLLSPSGLTYPLWNGATWVEDKDKTYTGTIAGIEAKKKEENLKDFFYDGNNYVSDQPSIQATQNECLTHDSGDSLLTLRGTIYEGKWAAVNGFVPFTCGEFLVFATEFFKRGSDNFTTCLVHKMAVDALYQDGTKTAQDILDYDYSQGWH